MIGNLLTLYIFYTFFGYGDPNLGCVTSVAMVMLPGDGDLLSSSVVSETLEIVMSKEMKHYIQFITITLFNIR